MDEVDVPPMLSGGNLLGLRWIKDILEYYPNSHKLLAAYNENNEYVIVAEAVNLRVFLPDRTNKSLDEIVGLPKLEVIGNYVPWWNEEGLDIAYPV